HDQLLDVARALERAGIRLEIERTAIAIRRVGVNYSRDRRTCSLPGRMTGRRHIHDGASVIGMSQRNDVGVTCINASQDHCGFVGFGSAVGEETLLQTAGRYPGKLFCEIGLRSIDVQGGGVSYGAYLIVYRL